MYGQYITVFYIDCIMWRSTHFHGNKDRNPGFYTPVALTFNCTNCFHREVEPWVIHAGTMCRSAWRAWSCVSCFFFFPLPKWQTQKISFSIRITPHNRQIKMSYMFNRSWFWFSTSNLTILSQGLFFAIFFTSSSTSRQLLLGLQTVRPRMCLWKRNVLD